MKRRLGMSGWSKRYLSVVLGSVILLAMARQTVAVDYYVAEDGDDLNAGILPEAAFATPAKAISTANSGDTIHIAPSSVPYIVNGPISFTKKLTIIGSSNPYETILDFNQKRGIEITNNGAAGTVISGVTIQNCKADSAAAVALYDTKGAAISNCVVRWCLSPNGSQAILRMQHGNSLISHCTIVSNSFKSQGITFPTATIQQQQGNLLNCIIADNILLNSTGKAAGIYAGGGNVVNCTIVRNSAPNVGGVYAANGNFYNCIIRDNYLSSDHAISDIYFSSDSSRSKFHNCCVYPIEGVKENQGNFQGYPAIDYDSGCYALSTLSDCIDAGSTNGILQYIGTLDAVGNERIVGDAIDVGAVEYSSAGESVFQCLIGGVRQTIALADGVVTTNLNLSSVTTETEDSLFYRWQILDVAGEVLKTVEGEDCASVECSFTFGSYSVRLTVTNLVTEEVATAYEDRFINIASSVLYVDLDNQNPQAPYSTRETAANDIATALACAPSSGATIRVAPNTYQISSCIVVNKDVHIIGEGGWRETIIDGNSISGQGPAGVDLRGGSMMNCLVYNNYASSGAGMGGGGVKFGGIGSIINSTIVSNRCDKSAFNAGIQGSTQGVKNCIVAFNYNGANGGYWDNLSSVFSELESSCIYPIGNLSADAVLEKKCMIENPGFVADVAGEVEEAIHAYALMKGSPCRDSGNVNLYDIEKYGEFDLLGNRRIDRKAPKGKIDMGAIEMPFIDPATILLIR